MEALGIKKDGLNGFGQKARDSMERLTTNKSVSDMSMVELAHNSCYVDSEGNARYRDYEMEMNAMRMPRNRDCVYGCRAVLVQIYITFQVRKISV